MDRYLHSNEGEKFDILANFDISKLNHFEIMGLYLLGIISSSELKDMYDVAPTKVRKIVENVLDAIDDYEIKEKDIAKNFVK